MAEARIASAYNLKTMNRLPIRFVLGLALTLGGVLASTALVGTLQSAFGIPGLIILYLLPVVAASVTFGWFTSVLGALFALLCYDFFLVEPFQTLAIRDPEEWPALMAFVAVAGVTSTLAARERKGRDSARRRADDASLLYELSRILGSSSGSERFEAFAARLKDALQLDGCSILLQDDGRRRELARSGDIGIGDVPDRVFGRTLNASNLGRWIRLVHRSAPRAAAVSFPLRSTDRFVGVLRLLGREQFTSEETRLLATASEQLSVALEQARLKEEAQQAEVLKRTELLRRALLSSVSHDLKTPLAAIKAAVGGLLQPDVSWSAAERQGLLTTIDREADRLDRLVGSLLDMSRIESGTLQLRRDWYDVGELAREVVSRLQAQLPACSIVLDAPDDLPPVELDYLLVDQVLTNLIENAAKYGPAAGSIQVVVRHDGASVLATVIDAGPGIPREERDRVFDKFYRMAGHSTVPGSGLGLSVSKGFVEAHGGRIWVDDAPGGGSAFCVELPAPPPPVRHEAALVEAIR